MLIAALLELKSRLMLPGEEVEELDELAPAEAAEELLERMLALRALPRRRRAGCASATRDGQAFLYRAAPLPAGLRRASLEQRRARLRPARARRRARRAAAHAAADRPRHMAMPRVTVGRAAGASCATCCARGHASRSTRRSRTPTA